MITTFVYDLASRPVISVTPDTSRTTTTYDVGLPPVATVDPAAGRVSFPYDPAAPRTRTATLGVLRTTAVYDSSSRCIGLAEPAPICTTIIAAGPPALPELFIKLGRQTSDEGADRVVKEIIQHPELPSWLARCSQAVFNRLAFKARIEQEDLRQETAAQFLGSLAHDGVKFDESRGGNITCWLDQVGSNTASKACRSQRRGCRHVVSVDPVQLDEYASPADRISDALDIAQAIDALPEERLRDAVRDFLQNCTIEESAELRGQSRSTAGELRQCAFDKLGRMLR